jgi:hypothetical protein
MLTWAGTRVETSAATTTNELAHNPFLSPKKQNHHRTISFLLFYAIEGHFEQYI